MKLNTRNWIILLSKFILVKEKKKKNLFLLIIIIRAQPNTRIMPRPKLFLHFKKSLPALQKAAEKYIPSGKAIEQEPTVNKKSGLPENPTTSRKCIFI